MRGEEEREKEEKEEEDKLCLRGYQVTEEHGTPEGRGQRSEGSHLIIVTAGSM